MDLKFAADTGFCCLAWVALSVLFVIAWAHARRRPRR